MSRTGWIYGDRFLDHDTGPQHPERPDRLRAILRGATLAGTLDRLTPISFEPADDELIRLGHDPAYVERLRAACRHGARCIDTNDSAICPESEEIARLAVGGALAACDAVLARRVDNAFCAQRPPGHHARSNLSAGFCLYNNVAIAARYAQRRHGIGRVMILDWDVHHGDGTQELFWEDPTVLMVSLHEDPRHCYPGTGFADETGAGAGEGFTLNIPMPTGSGDDAYHRAFEERIFPRAAEFRPDLLVVSNGLDAHADDPLAGVRLSDACYPWMMRQAERIAAAHCGGRFVVLLEGGYNLGVLERCVPRQLQMMMADAGVEST